MNNVIGQTARKLAHCHVLYSIASDTPRKMKQMGLNELFSYYICHALDCDCILYYEMLDEVVKQ